MNANHTDDLHSAGSDPLAERLRREALGARPEFSETLHRRIVRSIGERSATRTAAVEKRTAGRRWTAPAAALAAACALAVAAVGWQFGTDIFPANGRPAASEYDSMMALVLSGKLEDLPPIDVLNDRAAAGIGGLLSSSGFTYASSPLAHDALLAADSLLLRLPLDMEPAEERY